MSFIVCFIITALCCFDPVFTLQLQHRFVFDHFASADSLFVLSFWLNTCQINSHSDSFNPLSLLLLLELWSFARRLWRLI